MAPRERSGGDGLTYDSIVLTRPPKRVKVTTYNADGQVATFNDGKATVTYSYDDATDHDGKLVSLTDAQAGTFSGTYNANGGLATETYPSGLVATRHQDDAGEATSLSYAMGSSTWLTFAATYSAQGQIVTESGTKAGALTSRFDTPNWPHLDTPKWPHPLGSMMAGQR
jgi:uncharacterized protein RhaS with RHS repeats